jgi:tetratricopeptide (TPR) repeat protein
MQTAQPEIFFSYAWGGEKEEIALQLYQHLKKEGYNVLIDRYDVGYKGNIVQFMKRMGRASLMVVVISDKYLKSPYCMFELLEIYRRSNSDTEEMLDKIYPVVMEDADIHSAEGITQYVKHWEAKANSLKKEITSIELEYMADLVDEFKNRHEIALNVGLLAKVLKNIKTLDTKELSATNFEAIITELSAKAVARPATTGLPRHLTAPPFLSELFLGRETDLERVRQLLFGGDNLLLLVNGTGGMGKTSLAARYYHTHANLYAHLAWVLSEKSIANALLLLALPLGLRFDDQWNEAQRLDILLQTMANLPRPCLLVIDNANELPDLEAHYDALRRCPNFHLLLTTRITQYEKAAVCPVGALPYPDALKLFTEHYPGHPAADDALFEAVYDSVGRNTLVIELLAKNLALLNEVHTQYSLAQLVADLQQGLLAITQTRPVGVQYHGLLKGDPLDIIAAMYDMGELAPAEKRLLGIMAVLPAENIPFAALQALLPATAALADTLALLAKKGWLEHNKTAAAFKISPVVQEIVRKKNEGLLEDCGELIERLAQKLENDVQHISGCSYAEAPLYMRYAETLVGHWEMDNIAFDVLLEKLGSCHAIMGNLPKALQFYQLDAKLCQTLCQANPENENHKNAWAIANSRLGNIHASMGNLQEALRFYNDQTNLFQQLYDAYPDNVAFKNGLAISYEKLGQTYASMGNLQEALRFYNDYKLLMQQLYDAYPDNVAFKNGLAISFWKLGTVHEQQAQLPQARGFYQQAQVLWAQLAADFPDYTEFGRNLAIVVEKLAGLNG